MKKIAYTALRVMVSVYIGLCAVLYFLQDSLLYYPQGRAVSSDASTLHLKSQDADIVITTSVRSGDKAMIYFGGNGEDVSLSLGDFEQAFPDHSLYLMHYRSYGGSTGKPSEENIHADAVALYELVKQSHADISLIGRSLGTGVAAHLASERPVSKLVLVTPYNSIEEIAVESYPLFPVSLLLRDKYRSWQYAKDIKAPTTILMAELDRVIPKSSTLKLYNSFKRDSAKMVVIKGVGHNSISASERYYPVLRQAL